jgi:hypothetical protein
VAVAALEATACGVFAVAVVSEALSGPGGGVASSGGLVEGVAALAVGLAVVAVGVALARGARRTAGLYVVVQVLVVLVGLSQTATGAAAGRWAVAGAWAVATAVGAVGLWALTGLMRSAR